MFQVYVGVFLESLKKRSEVNNTKGCNLNSTVGIESFCLGTVVEPTHLEQICTSHIGNYEQKHTFVVIIKHEETTENLRIKVQVNLCTKHEMFWMSFPNIYDISCMFVFGIIQV